MEYTYFFFFRYSFICLANAVIFFSSSSVSSSNSLILSYAKLGLTLEIIKTFCDGYINWLENENNPKELGKFQGDTTDIERVGAIISMEYDLANDKIKELEDETDEEQKKIKVLAKQMKEYLKKKN